MTELAIGSCTTASRRLQNPAHPHTVMSQQRCTTEETGWSSRSTPQRLSTPGLHIRHIKPHIPPFQMIRSDKGSSQCGRYTPRGAVPALDKRVHHRIPAHSPLHKQSGTRADVATESGRIRIAEGRVSNVGMDKLPTSLHSRMASLERSLRRISLCCCKGLSMTLSLSERPIVSS